MQRAPMILLAGAAIAAGVVAFNPQEEAPVFERENFESADPSAVWDVIAAVPFRLAEPYTHWWRSEMPKVSTGHLVALSVDPEKFIPRQGLEPVLQVGLETAERINGGHLDGALIVFVPSEAGEDGWPRMDLASETIFLGDPALPEQIGVAHLEAQLAKTTAQPFGSRLAAALESGGEPLDLTDRVELEEVAARWMQTWAPGEDDKASGLLVPRER